MSVSVSDAPAGGVEIKKRSKVPGVMITQYVQELPHGKTTPDFSRKPIAVTIQEGKIAIFRAVVTGDPAPTVTWARNKGDVADPEKYKSRYDERSREYVLEIPNVSAEQADTYKCFATNSFGKAVCTASLTVIEAGLKKKKDNTQNDPEDFRKMLKKTVVVKKKKKEKPKKEGDIDPKFWELLLSAQKKDYERICRDFGITDFRWMLKKLNQMKKEREEENAKVVENVENLKQIEIKTSGRADFEFNMKLKDPNSKIYLYKDGDELEYSKGADSSSKHSMNKVGDKYTFSINNVGLQDAGLYQVDVEDATIFSTDLTVPDVEFDGMLKDSKVAEGQDASFECVLSGPVPKITWCANDVSVEHGDKYEITVSEDMLTHKLLVKNCKPEDKGIYTVLAGIKSSKASLTVEDDPNARWRGQSGTDDPNSLAGQQKERDEQDRKTNAVANAAGADDSGGSGFGDRTGGDGTKDNKDGMYGVGSGTEGLGKDASGKNIFSGDGLASNGSGGSLQAGFKGDQLFSIKMSDIYAIRGQPAELMCKLNSDTYNGTWSKDGQKLSSKPGMNILKDGGTHKLSIPSCKDSDAGQYQFEVNDHKTEAMLAVGDGPEFDADDLNKFSNPVIIKVGQTASFKMSFNPQPSLEISWFKDVSELMDGGGVKVVKEPNHSRLVMKDCLRSDSGEIKIQLKNLFGTVTALSRLIVLSKPCPPKGPVELIDSPDSVIEFKWNPPNDEGGSKVTNYIIERQQVGQSTWKKLGDVSADRTTFRDKNVSHGKRYIYRVYAENLEGISEPLETGSIMAGSLLFPGPPAPPKVVCAFKNCINLEWTPPEKDGGTKILGYQLEKRKKDTDQWIALNPVNEPIEALKYAVKEVSEGSEYEFRVSAVNASGAGEPSSPSLMVCAKNPNMKPHFKDPVDFMVVRAGNSVRILINYEASPPPEIKWQKDGTPVSPWINIINTEGTSMLVIPNSKHLNSGIYTITAKNSSGQASFDIEVRVTDEPKQPGPVSLEQWVHDKVIITWVPSPDQQLDDRLHYMVAEHNSNTRVWRTIADRLFCTTYTTNVQSGREYHFRVYAKNDMGLSEPSDSPTWGVNSNKGVSAMITLERPPSILVPLKVHTPPKGYQCYMTCAVRGCPAPSVSWYQNGICIDSNNHFYITNVHGVCSMYILRVGSDDGGEYKVVAVNSFGKAECSSKLKIRD